MPLSEITQAIFHLGGILIEISLFDWIVISWFSAIRIVLRHGADVNVHDSIVSWTPLHQAARRNQVAVAELLLNRGAHIDARDIEGKTPLAYATDRDMKALLRQYGAKE